MVTGDATIQSRFCTNIDRYPLVERYLGPSLKERLGTADWFENRILRYVIEDNPEFYDFIERPLEEASLDMILNSDDIFRELSGTQEDYDNQLFDAIAEIKLIRWAIQNQYTNIQKVARITPNGPKTPDFSMENNGEIVLAEAKRFRPRDSLLDLIEDRLYGLRLITEQPSQFGLDLESKQYYKERDCMPKPTNYEKIMKEREQKVRHELNEQTLKSWGRELETKKTIQTTIMGMTFTVARTEMIGNINLSSRPPKPELNLDLMLCKLRSELGTKLKQIQEYANSKYCKVNTYLV